MTNEMTKEERCELLYPIIKKMRWTYVAMGPETFTTAFAGIKFDWVNDDWDVLGDKILSLLDLLSCSKTVIYNALGEAENELNRDCILSFVACGALWFIKQELIDKLEQLQEKIMEIARVIVEYVSGTHQLREYIYYIDQIDQDT